MAPREVTGYFWGMGNKHIWINRHCNRSVSLSVLEAHGTDPDTPDLGHAGSFPALDGSGSTRCLFELVHQSPAHVPAVWLKLSALCLSTVCHAQGMFQYEKRYPAFLIFVYICQIHSHNLCISCLPPDVPVCVHKIEHSSKHTLQIHSCINIYLCITWKNTSANVQNSGRKLWDNGMWRKISLFLVNVFPDKYSCCECYKGGCYLMQDTKIGRCYHGEEGTSFTLFRLCHRLFFVWGSEGKGLIFRGICGFILKHLF